VGADDLRLGAEIVDEALAEREHVIGEERQHGQKQHGAADEQIHARDSAGDGLGAVQRCHWAPPCIIFPLTLSATLSSSELMPRCARVTASRLTENRTRFSTSWNWIMPPRLRKSGMSLTVSVGLVATAWRSSSTCACSVASMNRIAQPDSSAGCIRRRVL